MTAGLSLDIGQAKSFAIDANVAERGMALRRQAKAASPEQIRKTANDFESMFLEQMFNHMFATVPVNKTFGGGAGEETMRSFLVGAYAKQVTNGGGVGLSAAIAREMLRMQENANGDAR
ncbi:MAG: rod-binding protein [Tagaea sp.]|nr:rod-binding protein [Azospirillum sp.]MCA3264871.1 rod-binding protein [Azospirillum sp.]MCZ8125304.1 rod-binding protein [Magnetospirillum sp.]